MSTLRGSMWETGRTLQVLRAFGKMELAHCLQRCKQKLNRKLPADMYIIFIIYIYIYTHIYTHKTNINIHIYIHTLTNIVTYSGFRIFTSLHKRPSYFYICFCYFDFVCMCVCGIICWACLKCIAFVLVPKQILHFWPFCIILAFMAWPFAERMFKSAVQC